MIKKKTLLFNFSNSNSMVRLFYCMRFTDLNVGSLSNDNGDNNESAKKAIGQGCVYMEVGDPS